MLVAAGASLLVLDGAGLSSRQLALMAEDLELAEYLKSQEHFQVRLTSINTLRNYLKGLCNSTYFALDYKTNSNILGRKSCRW